MADTKTIAAIATPMGRGGVGVIRLSGAKAYEIACQLTNKTALSPRHATFRQFYDKGNNVIDEGIVLYFKAPHSFTGEDVVELQGHGGVILQNLLLSRVFELGATQAQAGEFSYRAFENDKVDLLQAEAIADAIDATSEAAARSAMRSLRGEFSERINNALEALIELRLYVEAAIDFPDEDDVDFLSDGIIKNKLKMLQQKVAQILQTAQQGQLLRDGVNVVIAGRPNAGKSSLLNSLAGQQRAIVTNIEGTTRDTLQETLVLNGLTIHLTDTAGLRHAADEVERLGIERAREAIEQADLLLLVYDLTKDTNPLTLSQELFSNSYNNSQDSGTNASKALNTSKLSLDSDKLLFIGNKRDLIPETLDDTTKISGYEQVNVSCETRQGIDSLVAMITKKVGFHPPENSLIARTRHLDALKRTETYLAEAYEQLVDYQAGELVAESLRQSQHALGEITGEFSADDLLGRIFGSFCIGK